jgi:hypothetical protein
LVFLFENLKILKRTHAVVFTVILAFCVFASCEKKEITYFKFKKDTLFKDSLYLVFRGTDTKAGFYAKDFNIKDSLSSHVGIAIYEDCWEIYNVLDFKDDFSDLRNQKFEEFFDFKKEKITYGSVWLIQDIDAIDIKRLKENLLVYKNKKISFDKIFSLQDSTKLYCSEFICNLLENTNPSKFSFKLYNRKFKSKSIYGIYFQKENLSYYPVDIFQYHKNFKKIKEWVN